eukprot:SAG31_NODE_185_length_20953_cov_17.235398_4_plen_227_part_00
MPRPGPPDPGCSVEDVVKEEITRPVHSPNSGLESEAALAATRASAPACVEIDVDVDDVVGAPEHSHYRVLHKTLVRSGIEPGTAACGPVDAGEIIAAQAYAVNSKGVGRIRFERGWVSTVAGNGTVLLAPADPPDGFGAESAVVGAPSPCPGRTAAAPSVAETTEQPLYGTGTRTPSAAAQRAGGRKSVPGRDHTIPSAWPLRCENNPLIMALNLSYEHATATAPD